jgi:hypothetical protein
MSFERVHSFIMRHTQVVTFVYVTGGKAKCIAADSIKAQQLINRIMLGYYEDTKPVGTYTSDVLETDLAQDLRYCGVET